MDKKSGTYFIPVAAFLYRCIKMDQSTLHANTIA